MRTADPRAATGDELSLAADEELDRRHIAEVARQGRALRWRIGLTIGVVCALAWGAVPMPLLLAWAALALAVREWRVVALARLADDERAFVAQRVRRMVLINLALGLTNGLAAGFMFWLDDTHDALLTMVLVAWAVGLLTTSGPMPRAYLSYTSSMFALLLVPWLAKGTPLGFGVAALIVLFALAQYRFMQYNAALFERSFRTRVRNEALVCELIAARDVAEGASRDKTRFLAAASHDLRQPLHALMLLSGLLAREPKAEDAPRHAAEIAALTQSLGKLIDALLDISKLDAGVVEVDLRAIRLHRLLAQLVRTYESQATAKALRLRLECGADLVVRSDPILLERLLGNLLDNAVKYSERGEVTLRAREAGWGGYVEVTVADQGCGIPELAQRQVFDEFFRLEGRGAQHVQGLGLGLAIVRRLAALLELPLRLESEVGRGTTVRLRLPLHSAVDEAAATVPAMVVALAGVRVLVIDDEAVVRRATRRALERWGCDARDAEGTVQALALVDRHGFVPDLVLADAQLARGDDGLAAIRRLRERCPGVLGLLISGDTHAARLREAEREGLVLLHKPLSLERLQTAIGAALSTRAAGDVSETTGANSWSPPR